MYVRDFMTENPVTVSPDDSVANAFALLKEHNVRRLPVVDANGFLVGIVTDSDLLKASPSGATTLNIWELNYLLSKMKIRDLIHHDVVTIDADEPLEKAALLMREKGIGGIPVMSEGRLVGIITESDIFKAFMEVMGLGERGARLTLELEHKPGQILQVAQILKAEGLNIESIATFHGRKPETREVVVRVKSTEPEALVEKLRAAGINVVHFDVF